MTPTILTPSHGCELRVCPECHDFFTANETKCSNDDAPLAPALCWLCDEPAVQLLLKKNVTPQCSQHTFQEAP